jgi:hypothetical protein
MKKTATVASLAVLLSGSMFMSPARVADSRALARESLERLRAASAASPAAQAAFRACLVTIAAAHHSENGGAPLPGSVEVAWTDAAARCRALAIAACDPPAGQPPSPACAGATSSGPSKGAESTLQQLLSMVFPGPGSGSRASPWWRHNEVPAGQK